MSELTDILSAAGSIIGGIAAGIGLFYVAFQFKKSVKQEYYKTLTDIADKIETLESSQDINTDHKLFSIKYLNLFERVASFANTGFIDKSIARYFENNIKQAIGLLEMKEYADYWKEFTALKQWCETEHLQPSAPPLPSPKIHITTDAKFCPNPHSARVGDFVTWINDNTTLHTVTSGTGQNDPNIGKDFDSPKSGVLALTKGKKFSHEFTTAGTFRYFCRMHPTKVGIVVVAPTSEDIKKVDHVADKVVAAEDRKGDHVADNINVIAPTTEDIKKLTQEDISMMTAYASLLKSNLEKYIQIDPFTKPDPFRDKDDYNYSIIVERQQPNRIIAMIAATKSILFPELPWNSQILDKRLTKLSLSKHDAAALKSEMTPKDTNNFYPYRYSDTTIGYIMFAFQICRIP